MILKVMRTLVFHDFNITKAIINAGYLRFIEQILIQERRTLL